MSDEAAVTLTGEDLETWSALATVLEWLPPALDGRLAEEAGVTHFEYGILYALSVAEGRRLRMSTLAGYANSTLSRLSRAVTRLERRGWLSRSPDPDDGRSTLASLTAAGDELVRTATPGHAALVHRVVLDRLTRSQQRQLREICARIQSGISDEAGWRP